MSRPVSKPVKQALRAVAENRVTHGMIGWWVDGSFAKNETRAALDFLLRDGYIQDGRHGGRCTVKAPKGDNALRTWFTEEAAQRWNAAGQRSRRGDR